MSAFKAITWNRPRVAQLRAAYDEAVRTGKHTMLGVEIEGQGKHDFDRGYAKHLLDWLAVEFAKPDEPRRPNNEGEEGQ